MICGAVSACVSFKCVQPDFCFGTWLVLASFGVHEHLRVSRAPADGLCVGFGLPLAFYLSGG
jgi:hypothetical protein